MKHFKEDCRILFEVSLSDIKEKPKTDLVINWLGQDVAQVLKSMGVEANSQD